MLAPRRYSFVIRAKATASARPATLSIPSIAAPPGTRSIFRRRVLRGSPTSSPSLGHLRLGRRSAFAPKYKSPGCPGLCLHEKTATHSLCLRLCSRCRGGRSWGFLAGRSLDTGSLSTKFTQVVESGAAHLALADHFNRADGGGVQRKNALDTYAKAHPAHRERRTGRSALLGDHHAFERLQALLFLLAVAFLQADIDTDGVTRPEFGEVFAQLRFM